MKLWRRKARGTRPRKPAKSPRDVSFVPPEGVPIRFRVASLGARFGAQMLDLFITGLGILIIMLALGFSGLASGSAMFGIGMLLFFAMRTPYYLASELFWNGRTIGKRFLGIRVVSGDGRALSPHAITVRNLMKEMEIFVPGSMLVAASALDGVTRLILIVWIIILLAVPLTNRRRQRLGDILANTCVVNSPAHVLLPELAAAPTDGSRYRFLPHHLDHYGRYELQTLERLLQADHSKLDARTRVRQEKTAGEVAATIAKRIDFGETVSDGEARGFLSAFYAAQRAYLENKQLFGDVRDDKFHKTEDTAM